MKLTIDPIKIPDQKPFQFDQLNRNEIVTDLTKLVENIDDNIVIAINGEWGCGKTTLLEMFRANLKCNNVDSIFFDAFRSDYLDDPFTAISSEIYNFINKACPKQKNKLKEFKSKASWVSVKALSASTKILIKAATLGIISHNELDDAEEILRTTSSSTNEVLSEYFSERLEQHRFHEETLEEFRNTLESLATSVKEKQNFPLVIIIDELDRCRPNYAVELLEKIKHFLDVKNIIFILSLNIDQLQESIKSVYGSGVDANKYLGKFINLEVSLDSSRKTDPNTNEYVKYSKFLYKEHDFDSAFNKETSISDVIATYSFLLSLSLRDMQRVYTKLVLYYSVRIGKIDDVYFSCLLIMFYVIDREYYLKIRAREVDSSDIVKKLNLNKYENDDPLFFYFNKEYFADLVAYIIDPLEKITLQDQNGGRIFRDRINEIRSMSAFNRGHFRSRENILEYFVDGVENGIKLHSNENNT